MTPFEDLVADWLRVTGRATAPQDIKVTPYGSDWAGDTENGFYSSFSVSIGFTEGLTKSPRWVTVEGEAMESLWKAVVAGKFGTG